MSEFLGTATYSPDDNKLRFYPDFRLSTEDYATIKAAGFVWAPKQELFVAPSWTPAREDLMLEWAGEIDDEDTSLVDRAEAKADRLEDLSDRRAADAERAHGAVEAITKHIPLGQPILVGHHSEKRARKDAERIENNMRKAVSAWDQSKYWKDRAAGALAHAKYKERADVRHRRIKTIEADRRKTERSMKEAEQSLALWNAVTTFDEAVEASNQGYWSFSFPLDKYPRDHHTYEGQMSLWSALRDGIINEQQAVARIVPCLERSIAHCRRWLAHYDNRLEYEKAMLAEQGGTAADKFDLQVGGQILVEGCWLTILKVNKSGGAVNSVSTVAPSYVTWVKSWKYGVEKIQGYKPPSEEQAAKVKAATKLPPLCNFPGEGFAVMTEADYKALGGWAKGIDGFGSYRHRIVNNKVARRLGVAQEKSEWGSTPVFLSDVKEKHPPVEPVAVPDLPRPERVAGGQRVFVPEPETKFDALKDQLKNGVQVVAVNQLFPTPPDVCREMVDLAEIGPGMSVLEPSAGTGNIITAILNDERSAVVTAVEVNQSLADALQRRGDVCNVIRSDFLSIGADGGQFDRVLMNPPFENGSDIKHINHALKFLKPGGILVAVCANGPRQQKEFGTTCDLWQALPAGTFADQGTNVNAAMLKIVK